MMQTPQGLTFPSNFNLKAMGKATEQFEATVLSIVSQHVDLPENAIQQRPSKDHKYLSLTINFTAQSQQQLDDIYRKLNASDEVLMTL